MNYELESYYHSASPQRILDKQINPLIQHLQTSNINSLHQLKMRLQQLSLKEDPPVFTKTLPVFTNPSSTIEKFYSVREGKIDKKASLPTKRNFYTLSPTSKSPEELRERIYIVSPVSKVKKHLVERINIE
jgi:hypothetical protein